MKKFIKDDLLHVLIILVIVAALLAAIAGSAQIAYLIAVSDLPEWMKFWLLSWGWEGGMRDEDCTIHSALS